MLYIYLRNNKLTMNNKQINNNNIEIWKNNIINMNLPNTCVCIRMKGKCTQSNNCICCQCRCNLYLLDMNIADKCIRFRYDPDI